MIFLIYWWPPIGVSPLSSASSVDTCSMVVSLSEGQQVLPHGDNLLEVGIQGCWASYIAQMGWVSDGSCCLPHCHPMSRSPTYVLTYNPMAAASLSQVCSKLLHSRLHPPITLCEAQDTGEGCREQHQKQGKLGHFHVQEEFCVLMTEWQARCHLNGRPPEVLVSIPPSSIISEYWVMPAFPLWEHKVLNITECTYPGNTWRIMFNYYQSCLSVTKYKSVSWGCSSRREGS